MEPVDVRHALVAKAVVVVQMDKRQREVVVHPAALVVHMVAVEARRLVVVLAAMVALAPSASYGPEQPVRSHLLKPAIYKF